MSDINTDRTKRLLTGKNLLESRFNIGGIKRRSFDKRQMVFSCMRNKLAPAKKHFQTKPSLFTHTGKLLGFVGGNGTQVFKIAFVSNKHDNDTRVGVIAQFLEPAVNIFICILLGYIVDEQCTDSSAVVSVQMRNG